MGSAWVNSWKNSCTYDVNNNLTEFNGQGWDGSAWVNSRKVSSKYDVNNNVTEYLYQLWKGSVWVNNRKDSFTYDVNNNVTEWLTQDWGGYHWVNVDKYIFLYIPTGIEQFEVEVSTFSLSNNYPNPFNPSTKISYTIPKRSNVNIKVFNLLGSEIAELVKGEIEAGSYDIEFNASELPSGVYFYRIKVYPANSGTGNPESSLGHVFIATKKMILLK